MSSPSDNIDTTSSSSGEIPAPSRRPIFKTETTGNYWSDVWEAFKRLSPRDDFERIGEIPCMRTSLLNGIASGAGIGVIRGLSAGAFVASNWAVGTFMVVAIGSWSVCQNNIVEERRQFQRVVEEMPKRYAKQDTNANADSGNNTPSPSA